MVNPLFIFLKVLYWLACLQINHVDAKIMKTTDNLQKLEMKLGQAAVLDYRAVVLPLVKSFLKV